MGEFAEWITALSKRLMPGTTVVHNVAYSAPPDPNKANGTEVIAACDYAGGDPYRGGRGQSFACKFYRSVTKNQPFEYMFSRCAPDLAAHTQIKSQDSIRSSTFLTAAHHGATLIIDAIDPKGTMDNRVYKRIGEVFGELSAYVPYFTGKPVEDIGVYYSLKSKFSPRNDCFTNYSGATNTIESLVSEHIPCGITGDFHGLGEYKLVIASSLTSEDAHDNKRLADYVRNGGCLYLSGGDDPELIKELFGADVTGYRARKLNAFTITVKCEHCPKSVLVVPQNEGLAFTFKDGFVTFVVQNPDIFNMFKILL